MAKKLANRLNANYMDVGNKENKSYMSVTPAQANELRNTVNEAYNNASTGGGVSASQIDLTDMLNTLRQSAEAQKETIKGSYGNQRQALLDSLKRYQEDIATARKQQTNAFNSNRADLEAQAYMANRAALQNAASRGLGGSGLQQLAQLQSQIEAGSATSKLANANQEAQDKLTQDLANKNEDITKSVQNLLSEEADKVNEIEANVANAQEQLKYNEAVRFQNALQQAQATNASLAASAAANANTSDLEAQTYRNALDSVVSDAINSFEGLNSKNLKAAYTTALNNLNNVAGQTYLGNDEINAYRKQLLNAYNNALNTKQTNTSSRNYFNPFSEWNTLGQQTADLINRLIS